MINGPLSGWLVADYSWRYLFFVEGAFPFVAMVIWLALITDRPTQAKWLSSAERDYLVTKIGAEQEALKKTAPKAASYKQLCKQRNLWTLIAIYLCFQIAVTSYGYWLPTILNQLTRAGIARTGWLSVAPYPFQILGVYAFASWSDRSGNRRLFTALPAIGFAACLFLSVQTKEMIWVSYGFLALTGFFLTGHQGVFWSMPPAIFPREIGGGARGIINGMGNLGGFVGPAMVGWFIGNRATDLPLELAIARDAGELARAVRVLPRSLSLF
jgi:sugar phosphate permease